MTDTLQQTPEARIEFLERRLNERGEQIETLKAALRFYRDAWVEVGAGNDVFFMPANELEEDQGAKAREVLPYD